MDVADGILLKPKKPFGKTTLGDVARRLKYRGKPKSLSRVRRRNSSGGSGAVALLQLIQPLSKYKAPVSLFIDRAIARCIQ